MRKMKRFLSAFLAATMIFSIQVPVKAESGSETARETASEEVDYTQFVDPFVGTDVDYGQLFPGSVVPYGLMKLSPDTYPHDGIDHAGYDYTKGKISGFSHTRIEGVGGQGTGGDILITPTYVRYTGRPSGDSRAMNIVKAQNGDKVEAAKPGYYSVNLWPKKGVDDNAAEDQSAGSIKAELTSDVRTGYHRYTFPEDGEVSLVTDLQYTYHHKYRDVIMDIEKLEDKVTMSGRFSAANVGGSGKYTMYFYMETSQPALEVNTWDDNGFGPLKEGTTVTGDDVGAVFTFLGRKDTPLEVKVSISPISAEQAKRDMGVEMSGWDFHKEREEARDAWNDVLSKVKVTSSETSDPDGRLKKLFYTHLYHMFTMPMNATSTDGTYRDVSPQNNVKVADGYTHYDSWTLWDDFKKYPIIGLVLPDVYADIGRSIADGLEAGLVTWSHDYQVVPNVRTEHAVALLADNIAKGADDIPNLAAAYEKAKEISDRVSDSDRRYRVDKMVEYCYDDWAISLLAKTLYEQTGDEKYMTDYEKYATRAFMYKELYKSDAVIPAEQYRDMVGMGENPVGSEPMGLLWGKRDDGSWRSGDPEQVGVQGLYQGSLWQYTFWDANDVSGLMDLMGGKDAMYRQLSYLMGEYDPDNGSRMLHTSDNEIDMHSPYLFNYVGRPTRTQYWTRQIYTDKSFTCGYTGAGGAKTYLFKLSPDGYKYAMDDDAGTMASTFVAACMGLYPVCPGDPTFQITSPVFEEIRLDVGNGKEFVIQSNHTSPENKYIKSATLNGESFDRTWLTYEEISRGGVIRYEMTADEDSCDWATDCAPVPSMSDNVDTAIYEDEQLSFSSMTFMESEENDGSIEDVITITVNDDAVTVNGEDGKEIDAANYKTANVPEGLAVKLVKKDSRTMELSLEGNAKAHGISSNIDNLNLELMDSLFTGSVTTKRKNQMFKIQYSDVTIQYSKDTVRASEDGTFQDSVMAVLKGNASFAGEAGEDFVESGKLSYSGLPEGMTLKAVKADDKNVEFKFTGTITADSYDRDGLKLTFADAAFSGAKAEQIIGSNYGGMKSIRILSEVNTAEKEKQVVLASLKETLEQAKAVDTSKYTLSSAAALNTAIEKAEALLADEASITLEQAKEANTALGAAVKGLAEVRDAYAKIEMENFDEWCMDLVNHENKNPLKTENSSDGDGTQQVANTFDGGWVKYSVDFGKTGPDSISVRYSGKGNCYADAAVEIRLGSPDGELVTTVNTPPTGSWSTYATATTALDAAAKAKLTGVKDVYVVFRGTYVPGSQYYTGNFNWMLFEGSGEEEKIHDVTNGQLLEAESFDSWCTDIHPSGNGPLKTEASNGGSGDAVANTFDQSWIKFDKINFGDKPMNRITANYKNKGGYCPADSRVEIRQGAPDGELLGTVMLPQVQESGWSGWTKTTAAIENSKLVGTMENIYLVFGGDMTGHTNWYICNLDYLKFEAKEYADAYEKLELEDYVADGDGLAVESQDGGKVVANTNSGEGLLLKGIDFGASAPEGITVRYSAANNCHADANIEIRLGAKDGELISRVMIPRTGSWSNSTEILVELDAVQRAKLTGEKDIYLLFGGSGASWVGNFNWIRFEQKMVPEENPELAELETLFNTLAPAKNKRDVQAKMDELYIPLRKALADAEDLLHAHVPTKEEVHAAYAALAAMEKPVVEALLAGEMAELKTEAKTYTAGNTSAESLKAIADALAKADAVTADSRYAAYEEAYDGLKDACDSREYAADKLLLGQKVKEANEILASIGTYVEASKDALKTAVEAAEAVLAKEGASEAEISGAAAAIDEAVGKLVAMSDKSGLEASVAEAKNLLDSGMLKDEQKQMLGEAKAKAEAVLARAGSEVYPPTNTEYSEAKKVLDDVISEVRDLISADLKAAVDALKKELEALDLTGYTEASAKAVEDAAAKAGAISADTPEEELLNILNEMKAAKEGLTADKTALAAAVSEAETLVKMTDVYTEESLKVLQTALDAAKAVNGSKDASVKEVADAKDALENAMEALVLDRSDLEAAITEAEALVKRIGYYTIASMKDLQAGLDAAKAVFDNADAKAEEIAAAAADLNAAIGAMVPWEFDDVTADDWYYDAVHYVYGKGIMTGYTETSFNPGDVLARAQFALTLYRMNGEKAVEYASVFPDVEEGIWFANAVLWANEAGVITGYGEAAGDRAGFFGPADNIQRQQMAVMMYRYAKYMKYDISETKPIDGYLDADQVDDYAKEAMEWAIGAGIISGKDGQTRLDPAGDTTRAECATILQRFVEKYTQD